MPITIFGIILLVILIYGLVRKKDIKEIYIYYLTVTLIVTLNIHMGYFLKLEDYKFTNDAFLIYIMMFFSFYILLVKSKVNKKWFITFILMLIILMLNYVMFLVNPYDEPVIIGDWQGYLLGKNVYSVLNRNSIKIGFYFFIIANFLIMTQVKELCTFEDIKKILANVINFSKISIVIGLIEFITKNFLKTKIVTDICIACFGVEGSQHDVLTNRSGLITLQGATKEASMYTTVLFYILLLFLLQNRLDIRKRKSNKFWMIAILFLFIVNPAMSGYIYLIIFGIIIVTAGFISGRVNIKRLMSRNFILIIISIIFSVFIWKYLIENYEIFLHSDNYIIQRVGRAIEQVRAVVFNVGDMVNSSEAQRISGIVYDLQMWPKRPLLGFGSGTLGCVSGMVSFLVDFGVIGIGIYFYMIISSCRINRNLIGQMILFCVEVWILPNLLLNDFKTVFLLVIPIICLVYGDIIQNEFYGKPELRG